VIDPASIALSALPSVPLDERRDLPTHAGIYFALGADDVVLTGAPKRPPSGRDIQPLVKAAIDCLMAAGGQTPGSGEAGGSLDQVLGIAPENVKLEIVRALRALADWQESMEGRRQPLAR
jgi:hypothetical protein